MICQIHIFIRLPSTPRQSYNISTGSGSSQDLCTITDPNRVLSRSLHHYGPKQGPLKIFTPLRKQRRSPQDLYTITDPNRVPSRSLHHYGPKQGPLKTSTPLRTQTESSQDLYTITDPNRVVSRSLHHYGPSTAAYSEHTYIAIILVHNK